MAAKTEGTSLEQLQTCKTRACVIAQPGVEIISSKKDNKERIVEETYKVTLKKGSTARAVMHGVLDVATLGLWEVAGTPMEGKLGEKKILVIKIYYDENENIEKVELVK